MEENLSTTSMPLSSSTNLSSPHDSPILSSDDLPIWRIILYSTLAALTLIYLTTTILLFYIRREKITDIQFRPLRLNILSTIATIMLCVTFCLRTAFWPNAYPCFLIHWPTYIGFFLWCTALVCRVLSFTWVARFNLAKLRMSKAYYRDQQTPKTGLTVTIIVDESEGKGRENRGSDLISKFRKLKDCATDKWLARFILYPITMLGFILTLVLQLTSKELTIIPVNKVCNIGVESVIMLVLLGLFLFIICPILFYMIYDIHDAYGVRNELVFTMVAGVITYVSYIVFEEAMPGFREYFGSYTFGWIAFILCHTLTITIPLLRTYKEKGSSKLNSSLSRMNSYSSRMSFRKTGRFAQFIDVLGKPELFDQYKECAAACFCTELILFLEEYQFLKVLVAQCCEPGHVMTVENSILEPPELLHPRDIRPTSRYSLFTDTSSIMRPATPISPRLVSTPCTISIVETISAAKWIPFPSELRNDYRVFYDMFFDSSSDLAINIRGSTVAAVKNQITNGEFEISMFEQAREEVLGLLYRNTFERFCRMFGYDFE